MGKQAHPDHSGSEFRDALPHGKVRGRGAGLNPGNRFEDVRLHVLGDALEEKRIESPDGVQVGTVVYDDAARTIINPVDVPDLSMKWTVNPYRGCEHGCIYCYARPGHEYLGMSSGLDFETRIFAKRDAARLLRKELAHPKWKGEAIVMSGVTDPYQPVERELKITRACLEVMAECNQPVGFITKNHMITRDIDLLSRMAKVNAASAAISITTLDPKLAAKMEPRASSPAARLAAVRELANAGIPVTVMTAPIVPGINDHEIPALLEAAKDAGASGAGYVMLRLPYQIKDLFLEWLQRHFPDRASKVESFIRGMRHGKLYDSTFYERQKGVGPHAEQVRATFKLFARRHGLAGNRRSLSSEGFSRPRDPANGPNMFDEPGLFDAA